MGEAYSKFKESPQSTGLVWALLQATNDDKNNAVGGFSGAAWVFEETASSYIFVTAKHVVGEKFFHSERSGIKNTFTFLGNRVGAFGESIPITSSDIFCGKNDIAFIVIAKSRFRTKSILIPRHAEHDYIGQNVFNLGFPNRGNPFTHFVIDPAFSMIAFSSGPWLQSGRVEAEAIVDFVAPDVVYDNALVMTLSQASEDGFSGGPVVLSESNEVVGLMSSVFSDFQGRLSKSRAVSIREIADLWQRCLK